MSKKSMGLLKSFKDIKDLKLDNTTSIKGIQSIKCLQQNNKRKQKRLVKPINNLGLNDDKIYQNFSIIQKQQNSMDKSLIEKSLGSHFALSSLTQDKTIKDVLIEKFKLCRVGESEYLLKKNDYASSFFILHDGKLILQVDGEVKRKILPGQCFGQLALLYSAPRSASIKADKVSYLWFIDRTTFRNAISESIKRNYKQNRDFIEKNQFFEHLTQSQKDKIASISMSQKFDRNAKLFKEGMLASSMYIVKSGKLKRTYNGVCTGYYQKGQSLEQYAVLEKGCNRKQTVNIVSQSAEVIALSVQEIEEVLGKSLPILIVRNQIKNELRKNNLSKLLSADHQNKILDCFQVRNALQNQLIAHPGLKCKELIFMVVQGSCFISQTNKPALFGLQCFNKNDREIHYDFQMKFQEQGKIVWTTLYQIEKSLGKTIQKCILSSKQQKKVIFQRQSILSQLKSFAQKYDLSKLEAVKKLGEGQFGTVLLVKDFVTQKNFALKCIAKNETIKYKLQKHLKRQKKVLEQISSPFIVQYIRSFKDNSYVYFLMEYINGLELFDTIRLIGILNLSQARFYTSILIHVLENLHSKMIIYRDLKPQNVMVCSDGYLKVVDLGTCKKFQSQSLHKTFTIIGTPNYMAPEILAGKGYTYSVDLWSLGVMLFQFMSGFVPFGQDAQDPYQIYQEILTCKLNFPKHMSNAHVNLLISQLLSKSPTLRLGGSYSKLKNHSFFAGLDWDSLAMKRQTAPFKVPKDKLSFEQKLNKLPTKPISSYLKHHGKPINSRKDLDLKWDEVF